MLLFEFIVTNTGNVPLTSVAVEDDVYGPICGVGSLDPLQSFTCSITVPAGLNQHMNTATVTGNYNGTTASDFDLAHYYGELAFVPAPAIDIEKHVNGEDADEAPGPTILEGDPVTFDFIVTNTGNVALTDVEVVDDQLGPLCGVGSLGVGGTFTCSFTVLAVVGLHTNIGTVTGSYNGNPVTDNDPANYTGTPKFIPNPLIDIEKWVNDDDADEAPGVLLIVGDPVVFEYIINNVGNVALTDVTVTDDILGPICGVSFLAVGDSASCTISGQTAIEGQYTNVGTASGVYNGAPVTDSDPANYFAKPPFVPDPKLDIEKFVNGQDADAAPGPTVPVGSVVTFTYVVTNIGNVTLENITVHDNMFVTRTNRVGLICTIPSLAPGESFTCSATSIAIAGQYMNIGKSYSYYGGGPKTGGILIKDVDYGFYFGQ
jgi:hypothetical protein